MENYTGVLRHGAEELEFELNGIEQGSAILTPEVARAIDGVRFIADHLKEEDDANNVSVWRNGVTGRGYREGLQGGVTGRGYKEGLHQQRETEENGSEPNRQPWRERGSRLGTKL